MTGVLVGLAVGLGLLLISRAGTPRRPRRAPSRRQRTAELLAQAGYPAVSPRQLVSLSAGCALVAFVLAAGASRSAPIGAAFAAFAGYGPWALVRMRQRRRAVELRELWPDVVDHLSSAVRAGLSLPEALAALGQRGPTPLRPAFVEFGDDYRATGRFAECLDRLKARLADPIADRILEALRLAREVGGSDLGRVLRALSQFLREDARTRAELATRAGWTVNAARVALAAPWVVLALMSLRPAAVAAYNTPAGVLVLLAGGGVSLGAYRLMLRLGRLPAEQRVLR